MIHEEACRPVKQLRLDVWMSGLCRGRTNTIWTIDDVDGNEDKNVDDNHDDDVDGEFRSRTKTVETCRQIRG